MADRDDITRWHLVQLTPEAAEAHDRRVHNCGPDVMLGWKPYTYRVTWGAISQWACHTEEELARKLRLDGVKVAGWTEWRDGIRTTRFVNA